MLTSFLRVLILYPLVIFGVRLMGKRQIGELQPTELVVTILISNIATLPLEDQNLPLLMGIAPMVALISFEVLLSFGVLRNKKLRRLLSGSPQIIVKNGCIDQKKLAELRFSLDDLMTALRGNGVFDLREVQLAIVETNGRVSVYQKAQNRPVTCADLHLHVQDAPPPEVLIADGCLSAEGIAAAGCTDADIQQMLAKQHLSAADVFLMTGDRNGIAQLIRKETTA